MHPHDYRAAAATGAATAKGGGGGRITRVLHGGRGKTELARHKKILAFARASYLKRGTDTC